MTFEENNIYHLYNRGNNQQPIFFDDENYLFFLRKIKTEIAPYCKILAYCLMPNHFHLMVYTTKKGCLFLDDKTRPTTLSGQTSTKKEMQVLTRKIGTLLSSYTRAINKKQNRTGSLFQQKTKAKCLIDNDEHYPKICFHYIHQNPLKANLVDKLENWEYSSFKDYTGLRKGELPEIEFCKQIITLPIKEKELYIESYEQILENKIDKLY